METPAAIACLTDVKSQNPPMRAIIQRVLEASVTVEGKRISAIGAGLLVLLGIEDGDGAEDVDWLCGKIARMRIFADDGGKMNRSVTEALPANRAISTRACRQLELLNRG